MKKKSKFLKLLDCSDNSRRLAFVWFKISNTQQQRSNNKRSDAKLSQNTSKAWIPSVIVFIVCLLLPNVRYNNRPYGQALELTDTVIDTIKFEFIISECLSLHESVYHATCTPLLSFHAQVFPVEHIRWQVIESGSWEPDHSVTCGELLVEPPAPKV